MMSGWISAVVMVRSRNRSSCSSAVTSSADDWVEWVGAGAATDDRGWCSCGDGGTNAVAADAVDSIMPPPTTASDVATSDAGAYVFIFRGKRRCGARVSGLLLAMEVGDFLTEAVLRRKANEVSCMLHAADAERGDERDGRYLVPARDQ